MNIVIFGLSVSNFLFYGGIVIMAAAAGYGDMYGGIYIYRAEIEKKA